MRRLLFTAILALACYAGHAQDSRIKVACVGDSITYGAGLDDPVGQSYPAVVASLLGDGYEVRNFGHSARTASDGGDRPYRVSPRFAEAMDFRPDIVTVMLGTNDSKPQNWDGERFRASLESMVKQLKALPSHPRVIMLSPPPVGVNRYNIRDSVVLHCILADVQFVAKRLDCEYVDMYTPFSGRRAVLFPDGVHPGVEGSRSMGALVAAAVLRQDLSEKVPYYPAVEQDVRDNVAAWQDLKFGMFIHWGTYSQRGVIESWSLCPENVDWQFKSRPREWSYEEYVRNYEALKNEFNPTGFDPSEWAAAARYAGMKYVVFTTKHHDGFCMFDTHQTDYRITSEDCPFHVNPRANIAKELFDAFRAEGLKAGAYYSVADWHHQDYWWRYFPPRDRCINYDTAKFPEKWPRFQDFMVAQLDELTGGEYGELSMVWFDLCTSVSRTSYAPVPWERFAETLRRNQPGIMMVARHTNTVWENYCTPEQEIPEDVLDYPWESCITMTHSWSWRPGAAYKSTQTILGMLVRIVARGGNLLLNVGPGPDGRLDADAYDRLRGIGDWMSVNSEGIYGTKPYVLDGDDHLFCTTKDGHVYVFYIADEGSDDLPAEICIPEVSPRTVTLLGTGGRRLKFTDLPEGGVRVHLPKSVVNSKPCHYIWCLRLD